MDIEFYNHGDIDYAIEEVSKYNSDLLIKTSTYIRDVCGGYGWMRGLVFEVVLPTRKCRRCGMYETEGDSYLLLAKQCNRHSWTKDELIKFSYDSIRDRKSLREAVNEWINK